MTPQDFAALIHGREYPFRVPSDLVAIAKQHGLVVVYGASDDLMEFDGAIYDERGCYDGGEAFVDAEGLIPERDNIEGDDELQKFFARQPKGKRIEALWAERDGISWTYKTEIPHATFEIMEDGQVYCIGMVFALADIEKAAS